MSDKRKQSLYFPEDMLEAMWREARRQDRSLSWIIQQAWKIAEPILKTYQSIEDQPETIQDGESGLPEA